MDTSTLVRSASYFPVADVTTTGDCYREGGTRDAFFWVANIEVLFSELRDKGADIVYPIVLQPYGMKEFAVRDCDGHVLGFGEEWPTIV